MTTIVDSLVVELGIDPKNFTKGQREAIEGLQNLEEEARRRSLNIEGSSQRAASALGGIKTQVLELFAVFAGGKGLIQFATDTIRTNSQLGRLERNLNISAATISKWQGVARIWGGDGAQMAQTFTTITDAVEGFKIGAISPLIAEFRNLSSAGGTVIDVNKGIEQTLLDISANLKKVHDQDPARAGLLGRRAGLDPGLYDLLVKGPEATKAMLDKVNALGPATRVATDAAGELERRWNSIGVKADAVGRNLLNSGVGNQITEAADFLNLSPAEASKKFWSRESWSWLVGSGGSPGAPAPAGGGTGAFTSQADKEAFIRAQAASRGIDPDVAVKVAKSEGFNQFLGDNGTSFGAFQLHVTPGGRGNAVGDQFRKATGLDPSDPANERAAIQFALDDARAHGWGAYHGAARVGLANNAGGAGSTVTSTTTIGTVNINAGANADGRQIGEKFVSTVKRQSFAAQANDGQN